MAPLGTECVRVFFQRSHIKQRHGHSLLVSRTTAELRISPELLLSTSRKKPCGLNGSSLFRRGRWETIQRLHSRSPSICPPRFTVMGITLMPKRGLYAFAAFFAAIQLYSSKKCFRYSDSWPETRCRSDCSGGAPCCNPRLA